MNLSLSLDQTFDLICALGATRTVLIQGGMGQGKTSLLRRLEEAKPNHVPVYFDCTTKSLGDLFLPDISRNANQPYVSFVPNEEFGLHLGRPVLLCIDELGKAGPSTKNALMRTMYEHVVGNTRLPEGSIVFATTNLLGEGLGDMILPHHRNRIVVVKLRNTTNHEWMSWAINSDIDPVVIAWARDNPQAFHSFEDYERPSDNEMIFHPKAHRAAFTTPRSMQTASDIIKLRDRLDHTTLHAALAGAIGGYAAADMVAYTDMVNKMPTMESIKRIPDTALVPDSVPALCMLSIKALQTVDASWLDAWLTYMFRLRTDAQALFVNGVGASSYNPSKRDMVMNHPRFTQWLHKYGYLFGNDKT